MTDLVVPVMPALGGLLMIIMGLALMSAAHRMRKYRLRSEYLERRLQEVTDELLRRTVQHQEELLRLQLSTRVNTDNVR